MNLKYIPDAFCFLIGVVLIFFSTCKKDSYQRVDFTPVVIDSIIKISLDSVHVFCEIKDLEKVSGGVYSYGINWTASTDGVVDVALFENTIRLGALNGNEPRGYFDAVLNVKLGIPNYFAAYATPDNDRFFYSKTETYSTGTGSVFTDPVYYEGHFNYEMKGHLSGIEKGLTVVQHGFCWSLINDDPRFDSDTIQLGAFENEEGFEFKYLHYADSTAEINPHYIRSYAVFRNPIGEEETVFGEVYTFDGDFNFWTPIEDYPGDPRAAASCFVINGIAYVGAGWSGIGGQSAFSDFWAYDTIGGWGPGPIDFFPGATAPLGGSAFTINGKGYLGVGQGYGAGDKNFWEFDPSDNSWSIAGFLPSQIDLIPIGGIGFSINDSVGYFGTGQAGATAKSDFFEYNPAVNPDALIQLTHFGGGHRSEATGFAIGGKGYIGLGRTLDIYEYNPECEHDPSCHAWARKADFPGERRAYTFGFVINGKGYVGGGEPQISEELLTDFWEFDPNDASDGYDENGNPIGKWFKRANLPRDIGEGVGFAIGQKGYAGLGNEYGIALYRSMWEYNP
ncbi:MAG: Kelch repeat-containing protein [Saprospiraceae bacterium]